MQASPAGWFLVIFIVSVTLIFGGYAVWWQWHLMKLQKQSTWWQELLMKIKNRR